MKKSPLLIMYTGNSDSFSVVKNRLLTPIVVKLIRIVPMMDPGFPISLRIEVYGCGEGDESVQETTTPSFIVETTKKTIVTSTEPVESTVKPGKLRITSESLRTMYCT